MACQKGLRHVVSHAVATELRTICAKPGTKLGYVKLIEIVESSGRLALPRGGRNDRRWNKHERPSGITERVGANASLDDGGNGIHMETIYNESEIEKILSEADELLNRLNSGLIEDMDETRRTQLEIHASELKKRRLEVQGKIERDKTSNHDSSQGIHEAVDDIVKAMKSLAGYLT